MKGVGTFRRSMLAVAGMLGLGARPLPTGLPVPPRLNKQSDPEDRKRKPRRHRGKFIKRTHNLRRAGWPLIYWGDCPKPVSRKVLKKIASNHPLLTK